MAKFYSLHSWVIIRNVYIFFIHSPIDGCLGFLRLMAIVSRASVNIRVHVSFWIIVSIFLSYRPRSGISGWGSGSISTFLENLHVIFHSGCTSLHPRQQCALIPTSLPTLVICCLFDDGHSDRCEVIFHWGFDLHFPIFVHLFHVPIGHMFVFFGKMYVITYMLNLRNKTNKWI